ncbi:16S rRNA (guanine(966)-N(2))-methyltransferase RsmD [Marilutibacter chinensis]|uniref:Ribosomal RNA small subunit methyltransferase D n=1 Tax=Marilutibacter chinensis TaxID=2912247 RepID=A0ABS9HVI8_9GAMM|nr:16S rRNA (guanine(966)-N(2))-methyltransferase RsmD [Lysobacter chinensis]MCF7222748.1 16S rRNA (guanine(966)-N(2))-methyltransferase RsmD [Lysobacter chinensis]
MTARRRNGAARPAPTGTRNASAPGRVRLIGGRWRGTRLEVPAVEGLRPTPDRVRETLFNWLMPVLPGARVLDLFAGSGALGLEAVSRGAASATLVERDRDLARSLRAVAARLPGGDAVSVVEADARHWLAGVPEAAFDIAFVDPPFAEGLWNAVLPLLSSRVAANGWLYVEAPLDAAPTPPPGWTLHREGRTREVGYALYRRSVPAG